MNQRRPKAGRPSTRLVAVACLAALVMAACTSGGQESTNASTTGVDGASDDGAADGAAAAGLSAPAGDDAVALELVNEGVLTVCTDPVFPPFEYVDDEAPSGYAGFDLDLIEAVAAAVDLAPVEIVEVGFEQIASGDAFSEGVCDVGASAIALTPNRAERLDFTDVYYEARPALLVAEDSGIDELGDLGPDHVLGVQRETRAADRAAEQVEGATIQVFDDSESLLEAFDDGELDAVLHDLSVTSDKAASHGDLEVVDEARRVSRFGFAVAAGREDGLVERLDEGLEVVREDGTYDELFERYFATDG